MNKRYMEIYEGTIERVKQAEVIVCGGGCAGVVAAIASGRSGAKTILLEKTAVIGGTATNGLVGPFMTCFDPQGEHQIVKGIFDEMVCRMEEKGGAIHPSKTGRVSDYGCYIELRHNNDQILDSGGKLFFYGVCALCNKFERQQKHLQRNCIIYRY